MLFIQFWNRVLLKLRGTMHLSPQPCYFRNHGEENLKLSLAYMESYEQSVVEFWLTSSVLHQEQDYRGEKIWSRSVKRLRGSRLKLTEIRRGVWYMPATATGCYTWLRFLCEDRQQFKAHQFAITVAPFVWGGNTSNRWSSFTVLWIFPSNQMPYVYGDVPQLNYMTKTYCKVTKAWWHIIRENGCLRK